MDWIAGIITPFSLGREVDRNLKLAWERGEWGGWNCWNPNSIMSRRGWIGLLESSVSLRGEEMDWIPGITTPFSLGWGKINRIAGIVIPEELWTARDAYSAVWQAPYAYAQSIAAWGVRGEGGGGGGGKVHAPTLNVHDVCKFQQTS